MLVGRTVDLLHSQHLTICFRSAHLRPGSLVGPYACARAMAMQIDGAGDAPTRLHYSEVVSGCYLYFTSAVFSGSTSIFAGVATSGIVCDDVAPLTKHIFASLRPSLYVNTMGM